MQTRQHTNIFLLIIAMLIGIATTSVVSIFTTQYADTVCCAIEKETSAEQQKLLFTQLQALNVQVTANSSKLPTFSTHASAKRTNNQSSNLDLQLHFANKIVQTSLREGRYNRVLSCSHQPPLYYIFALHRMRD